MSKIVVELDAYVISDDHRVFKCSPGKTYRFYKEVKRANAVFLDIRGLDQISENAENWDDKEILKIIADDRWNREVQSRERGNEPVGQEGIGKSDRTKLGFLKALLFEAKVGDLIVVPVDGYNKDVLIGEVLDPPGDFRSIVAKDEEADFVYLGRRVQWRAGIPKRLLSEQLIKAIHTQTALFMLARDLHEEIYRLAYQNFVYRGEFAAEFLTAKEKFTAEDHAVFSTWLNGFDVLRNTQQFPGDRLPSFYELGLTSLEDALAADVRIDIQSPGDIFVKSVGPFAMALMVFFALPSCDSQQIIDNGVTVKLKVVGSSDGTNASVEQCVNSMAIALGVARLDEACSLSDRAAKDAKLKTRATLKSGTKESN